LRKRYAGAALPLLLDTATGREITVRSEGRNGNNQTNQAKQKTAIEEPHSVHLSGNGNRLPK
jgi:hypothetical protein